VTWRCNVASCAAVVTDVGYTHALPLRLPALAGWPWPPGVVFIIILPPPGWVARLAGLTLEACVSGWPEWRTTYIDLKQAPAGRGVSQRATLTTDRPVMSPTCEWASCCSAANNAVYNRITLPYSVSHGRAQCQIADVIWKTQREPVALPAAWLRLYNHFYLHAAALCIHLNVFDSVLEGRMFPGWRT